MVTALTGNHHRLDFLIGPGKALDTTKYFIVCTDAIGNGLTTSPSTSKAQPRMQFPRFTIRDMVHSQQKLLKDKLGIEHVVTVVGPSMGGMQALQWGVSYPDYMDSLAALVPLARTPAWSILVVEASRKAIMLDPVWNGGNYTSPPVNGIRVWRDMLNFLTARTPELYRHQFANPLEVLPWLKAQEDAVLTVFDANDYIYQTWAYETHDVGTTPGMNGDYAKALRAIKAKTLMMIGVKDLLNPEWEPLEAARYIRDVRTVTINPESVTGHYAAGGFLPPDVEQINAEVERFLEVVTQRGHKLK
jgi:homoserine O-acetyltransferase